MGYALYTILRRGQQIEAGYSVTDTAERTAARTRYTAAWPACAETYPVVTSTDAAATSAKTTCTCPTRASPDGGAGRAFPAPATTPRRPV